MPQIHLENQEAEPIDEATHAALDEAEAAIERGEFVTLEQAQINLRKRYLAWQKAQEKIPA